MTYGSDLYLLAVKVFPEYPAGLFIVLDDRDV